MKNITLSTRENIVVIDNIARSIYGTDCYGVTVNSSGTTIHITDNANDNKARSMLDNIGSLPVTTNKASITADNADTTTITITGAIVASDSELIYNVVDSDGTLIASDTVPVTTGTATLTFATDLPDIYTVTVARTTGDYSSGAVTIIAS